MVRTLDTGIADQHVERVEGPFCLVKKRRMSALLATTPLTE
jgi:hypothetical protein